MKSGVDGALLWHCLVKPEHMTTLGGGALADLMTLAWRQALGLRLASVAKDAGVVPDLPRHTAAGLESLATEAGHNARRMGWEIDRIAAAFRDVPFPVLLLKGAAYHAADFGFAAGRMASDVDILVPKDNIAQAETALRAAGWIMEDKSAYDMRYYRDWMHEMPPMRHSKRQTLIDLHHNLLPPVGRIHPDIVALLDASVEVDAQPLRRPALVDLTVHSILHCFYDGDFSENLRNMLDIRDLIRLGLAAEADYVDRLIERAAVHRAGRPVADALATLNRMHALDLNQDQSNFIKQNRRNFIAQTAFSWSVKQRTLSVQPHARAESWLARLLLYIRSHWITMPPRMLVQHLTRKAVMRLIG